MIIMVMRMQLTDQRKYNIYHTLLCLPLMVVWAMQGAWVLFALTVVGAARTLLLATDWGWMRRSMVVGSCLIIALMAGYINAHTVLDYLLLVSTTWCVGSEAFKNMFNLKSATIFNSFLWALNGMVYGAYINVLANFLSMASGFIALERDYILSTRFRASVLGCEVSRALCLARAA
jgi:hypothetical protein